jgi:hypothetical protein
MKDVWSRCQTLSSRKENEKEINGIVELELGEPVIYIGNESTKPVNVNNTSLVFSLLISFTNSIFSMIHRFYYTHLLLLVSLFW